MYEDRYLKVWAFKLQIGRATRVYLEQDRRRCHGTWVAKTIHGSRELTAKAEVGEEAADTIRGTATVEEGMAEVNYEHLSST